MLKLTQEIKEKIKVAAFGGLKKNTQHDKTVTVCLQTDGKDKVPVRVLILPKIAAPIEKCGISCS
ncbi:hypothetical protein DPMN_017940 [Dreissena polymorpha]|uniref:Uncharacterized protein n=1 Tax=Dreissena polymorpha TaxID=45954 RepID=A0A9D4S5Y0_DREPO|nr:hypothetical protein DPMN_017940 [Dreissena polymorpha]